MSNQHTVPVISLLSVQYFRKLIYLNWITIWKLPKLRCKILRTKKLIQMTQDNKKA